ncbi:retroviral-like aspartic protease family protein [Altererythrobacter sp. MF3-039]|uniref:retroviral-like aspartic protease family protein n=1 Tax=Altererythrobacter sp. MF3-039 TaxID=3252901 RepID=UPI00390CC0D1
MTGIKLFLLVGLFSVGDPVPSDQAPTPKVPSDPASADEVIQTDTERYERLTVPVTISGEGPFRFMIDTGAQATAVTRGVEQQLQLPPAGVATLVGMASRQVVDLVELDDLELGSRTIHNIQAPVLERRNVGADGILGIDSLQGLRVLLDFRQDSISVADATELGGNKGYDIVVRATRRDGQLLITDAMIDGVRTAVIIDTGAQMSVGNLALRRKLRARLNGTSISTDVLGNSLEGEIGVARSLEIDGLKIENLAISYADTPAFDALGLGRRPALSLGMYHLRMFDRVAIDFDTRRILFDLPRGARRPPLHEIFSAGG